MNAETLTFDQLPQAVGMLVNQVGSLRAMLENLPAATTGIDEPMDLGEAAAFIKLAPKTVSAMAANGELPHSKPAKKLIFFRSELVQWIKDSRRKTLKEHEAEVDSHIATPQAAA